MQKEFSGFIFDFDGVIADSIAIHLSCWNLALQAVFAIEQTDLSKFIGKSTTKIAMDLAGESGDISRAHELAAAKRQFLENCPDAISLLPGAAEVISFLDLQGIPWSIGSNANRAFIESTLLKNGLQAPIVVGIDDASRGKPSPEIFLRCAKIMHISPADHSELAVFEDSTHGIAAAIAAGMYPIGITSQHSSAVLLGAGARSCFSSLKEAFDAGLFTAQQMRS